MNEPTPIQRKPACFQPQQSDERRLTILREKLQRLLNGAARTNDEIIALERRIERKAA